MRRLLDEAEVFHPQAQTLLDIGAGTGLLVDEAKKRGMRTAEGVEVSRWCVETAATMNRIDLHCGTLQENSHRLGEYDIVTLIDIVEHTTDPRDLIHTAVRHLRTGGVLVIVTPDIASFAARSMGRWWWHHRIAHVCYFNRRSMRQVLEQTGLQIVAENHAGWRLPVSYLCERLKVYLGFPVVRNVLSRLASSKRLAAYSININLRDSRTFIAKKLPRV
jgi:2-polyprenyl-3-methyl-5-hydroxy-6-metoxy-1,4-benzoquinol methylase